MCKLAFTLVCLALFSIPRMTYPAPWIAPDWGDKEPQFPPGSLFWKTNEYNRCPVLYRTIIDVEDKPIAFAGFRIRASWFTYVFLNGRQIDSYLQKGEGAITNPFDVELSHLLQPGQNLLILTTTGDGFSLDGGIGYEDGTLQSVSSDLERWKVQKFPPLTMLEYEPCMKPDYDDSDWFSVRESDREPVGVSDEGLRELCQDLTNERLKRLDDDAKWRLDMLAEKGISIVDWEARGWAGAARIPGWVRSAARSDLRHEPPGSYHTLAEALTRYVCLSDDATNLENHLVGLKALEAPDTEISACRDAAGAVRHVVGNAENAIKGGEYNQAVDIAAKGEAAMAEVRRTRIINDLCCSLDNKFGWFDNNALLDNNMANWGIRVNPVQVSWRMNLDGKWRFRTDPENTGLEEKRHTFGYNIENQWDELNVPGSWERQGVQQVNPKAVEQSPYPGVNVRTDGPYNGWAWYRKTLRVPQEWAGYDLELSVSMIDDWDWTYFNGEEIGHTGADTEGWWHVPRQYHIPKELVQFGGYNVIAFRIYDCGAEGVLGSVELQCPGLKDAFESKPEEEYVPTTVFASPLSPAALLTVGGNELVMWGWDQRGIPGPDQVVAVIDGQPEVLEQDADGIAYNRAEDGDLGENWLLLSGGSSDDGDKPIELVFLSKPEKIVLKPGGRGTGEVVITFRKPGARLLALRPIRKQNQDAADACRFWSRALLKYPVTFSEAFIRDPAGKWAILVADVYNYWELKDDWETKPIQMAPLPPLACYGLKKEYPGLDVISPIMKPGYSLGEWGEMMAAVGQNYITYRVPLDPIKRFGGSTSFCFGPTDIGEPGNIKEIETIKRTGANSYRPQHNQNGERAMKVVEWCWEQGIQNVFNVDGDYAGRDTIFDHYRKLAQQCKDLPPDAVAYDLINEPASMEPDYYNPRVKELTRIIREIDKTHLIYIETPHSFASVSQFVNLEPTGDELTNYSFHDYDYRLLPRWPNRDLDIRNIMAQWLPAFRFSIDHRRPIHLGEFGGFEQTRQSVYDNKCAITLMMDFLRIFDQFGWHWHYYANRGVVRMREDGSLHESHVQDAYRRYFARGTFNANR